MTSMADHSLFTAKAELSVNTINAYMHFMLTRGIAQREKGRDLTQSYDKSPYTSRNVKKAR